MKESIGESTRCDGDSNEASRVEDMDVLECAARLMGLGAGQLAQAMTTREMVTVRESFIKPDTADSAYYARDSLVKALYSRMFDYLGLRINQAIKLQGEHLQLGVLDIYGFEILERNSCEQLCANYVNEHLQQAFIQLTLRAEQEEYSREDIP